MNVGPRGRLLEHGREMELPVSLGQDLSNRFLRDVPCVAYWLLIAFTSRSTMSSSA